MRHRAATSLALVLLVAGDAAAQDRGARDPVHGPDGRLAVSRYGDLWVRGAGPDGAWTRVTTGPAWDREPAWSADGAALVFASDRAGTSDIWRVALAPERGEPERLTSASEWEGEPAVLPDGTVLFVRGRGAAARLWLRTADGRERRITSDTLGAERWPAVAPEGDRIAYVRITRGGSALRIRWLAGDSAHTVLDDRAVQRPAWAPDGERLAFATRRGQQGVWVTDARGSYVNLVSAVPAAPAWTPDGRRLTLAELPTADPSYNGDPDRVGEREHLDLFPAAGSLWSVEAPAPPDAAAVPLALGPVDRAERNAAAFDRVWERTAGLYYAGPEARERRARWQRLRATFRPRALAAASDAELEAVLHELWQARPPLAASAAGRAAVSSAHPVATSAGLEILRKGGNVVDAAIAVSFALGVAEPDASGIGGYGQMLIHLPGFEAPTLIEFMTRVPEDAALANARLLEDGRYPDDGPVLANVPGTVAAMELAFERYGSGNVTWADLLAPAIRAAEQGVRVSDGVATTLAREREHYLKYEGPRRLFFPNGEPLRAGDTLRNPDLARTLRQIAAGGARAFYHGEIAQRLVRDLRGQGNAMQLTDLARYYAVERPAVSTTYRGHTVFSSAPPSQGGATLAAQLNHLELAPRPRPYTEDAASLHAMLEAWKLVPATRDRIADPGLWPVTTAAFVSKDSARARWQCFDPARALTPDDLRGTTPACAEAGPAVAPADAVPERRDARPASDVCPSEGRLTAAGHCHLAGTTSFAVADASGAVVSVTQTLGTWGGNFYLTPGLGFLYNDKLTSYALDPDRYGARLPHARHGSSIAPTIVYRGTGAEQRPLLATGAAGNQWITSTVYAIVTGVVDHGLDPQAAIELPRFFMRRAERDGEPTFVIEVEAGIHPDAVRALETLGHRVRAIALKGELRMGYAAAVVLDGRQVTAGADPRRSGTAGAIGCGERERDECRR